MPIEVGLEATVHHMVTGADTAAALGSGDVEVFGTPAVIALCERAAVAAVTESVGANETTVGVRVDLEHVAPTMPSTDVSATALLCGIDGRRLKFNVTVSDPAGIVARGTHTRVVVDRDRFMVGAQSRS